VGALWQDNEIVRGVRIIGLIEELLDYFIKF